MSTIASHSPLNISETVRDRGLVPKDHQYKMEYGVMVTWRWRHVTLKGQGHMTPIRLEPKMSKTAGDAIWQQLLITIDSLRWGSTIGYPSDSLASCLFFRID